MERQSMIHQVTIKDSDHTYEASYFVEAGVIHACVDGQLLMRTVVDTAPGDTVRAMLQARVASHARKRETASNWVARVQRLNRAKGDA